MRRVEIDDDVYVHLQQNAIPFVETPNDTLRRLLGIGSQSNGRSKKPVAGTRPVSAPRSTGRRPKANLAELIAAGILANGQRLHLRDYQGNRIAGSEAAVAGQGLYVGSRQRLYSMSDLARELLQKEGFQSDSVRGPAHWFTDDGVSVSTLWEKHLAARG